MTDPIQPTLSEAVREIVLLSMEMRAIDLSARSAATRLIMAKLTPLLESAEAMNADRLSIMAQEPRYYDTCMGYVRYRDARAAIIAAGKGN